MSGGIHGGHRERLRQQYLSRGLEGFPDVNALELLLFYAIPRKDTNPVAHRLLETFGSLRGVLDASLEDLKQKGGLTDNAAALLKLCTDVARRGEIQRASLENVLQTTEQCGDYLMPFFFGAATEQVYALALDSKCKVLGCRRLFEGSLSSAAMNTRTVVEYALRLNAASLVLAHNHTSGFAVHSEADIQTTRHLAAALSQVDVLLADHIVVAGGDYVSMADSGYLD